MTDEEVVHYWMECAEYDLQAMEANFDSGQYVWALFLAHLVIEKLLKACCTGTIGRDIPRTHNLLLLAEKAGLQINAVQEKTLDSLITFNTRCRYPDWQREFL